MLSLAAGMIRPGRGQEEDMHPDYVEKAPRGAGWYILLEDGTMLEGGPYPNEEATWAEIALRTLREPKEEANHGRAPPGPTEAARSSLRQARRR